MDRFRELTTFVAVAEEQAFNAAARRLGQSAPVVTRLISTLEDRIGARLFTRTTRSVTLTDAGQTLLADAGRILAELEDLEAAAAGAHQDPRGELHVTAPVQFGQRYILPILGDFLDNYPNVQATAQFLDRVVHIVDEGFDVALRIGTLSDSSHFATRVGTVRHVTVAASAYLKTSGIPKVPKELAGHRVINPGNLHGSREWLYHKAGKTTTAQIEPRLRVNTATAALDACVKGWGITRLLSHQAADALAAGDLVEILSDSEDREIPVQLVHSEGRRAAAKTRAFIDFATQRLRAEAKHLGAY